jgi:hypothetical protein
MDIVPNELLIEVAAHLTIADLDSLEKASSRFLKLLSRNELDWIWKPLFEREYTRYQDDDYQYRSTDEDMDTFDLCSHYYLDGLLSDEDPEVENMEEDLRNFYWDSRERRMNCADYIKAKKISKTSWRSRAKRFLMEEDRLVQIAANVILTEDPPATLEQIRETEARLSIEIPRPIRKLYLLKNGGKIKHWDKEILLPLSQWTINGPLEYSEQYLDNKIEGSNMHRTLDIERFVKKNSSDEKREYWKKFICFVKGSGRHWNTGLFFMFFNGHPYDSHSVEDVWCLWEHTDPSGNGGYHKTHCRQYRNGTDREIARLHTFLKELTTYECYRLPY